VRGTRTPIVANAAIVILADVESHADHGRLANGLETAKEFAETEGDKVTVIFDGAGTQWVPRLVDPDGDYHELYESISDHAAVCEYCAGAFDVADDVEATDVETRDEFEGHPSLRSLVADGYEIITF
jgi:hypothetical protein